MRREQPVSSEPMLRELRKISRILILAHASAVEKELSKIATTDERKKIWALMDGTRMPKDLAKEAGVTSMAVSIFLNAGAAAELIEYKRGEPPRRALDYVPPAWLEFVKMPAPEEGEPKGQVTLATPTQGHAPEAGKSTGEVKPLENEPSA